MPLSQTSVHAPEELPGELTLATLMIFSTAMLRQQVLCAMKYSLYI
jgi:hypothetical protein